MNTMTKRLVWAAAALVALTGQAALGAVRYVKADATGANTGSSWADAYTDLQAALAAAEWGDEIWVARATYKPTSGTDRAKSFVMAAGVGIYGGFVGGETAREQRNWTANETILSGDIGVAGNVADNSFHVVAGGYNAVLDGFTIKSGNDNGSGGGGMYNESASLTVSNCTFTSNSSRSGYGGGMYNYSASPAVTNCTFTSNSGRGMYNYSSSPTVTNCTFTSNSGGGMYNDSANPAFPTVTNCTFTSNSATAVSSADHGGGGMMYNSGGTLTVTSCAFSGNSASDGGGMSLGGSPTVTNCTLNGNSATSTPQRGFLKV